MGKLVFENNQLVNEFLSKNEFIFIIGAPRSGTTWLNHILCLTTKIKSFGNVEINLFDLYINFFLTERRKEITRAQNPELFQGLNCVFDDSQFEDFLKSMIYKVYSNLPNIDSNKNNLIIDKNPNYSYHLETILKLIPNAIFIEVIRDGRDVCSSLKETKKKYGFGVKDGGNGALIWKKNLDACNKFKILHPEKIISVKYEDLVHNPFTPLLELFNFIYKKDMSQEVLELLKHPEFDKKLSGNSEENNKMRSQGRSIWRSKLTLIDKYLFYKNDGDWLFRLGYESNRKWWKNNSLDLFYIFWFHFQNKLNNILGTK